MTARRSLYGLDGINFFIAAMQTAFGAFITVYLTENRWTPEEVGFALTISTLTSLVSQMPAGALVDGMRDKRRAVRLGTAGVGVAALILALTPSEPAVYFAEGLQGVASSLIGPAIASTSLALVGTGAFSERVGRNARFASIGNGLTAGIMGVIGSYIAPVAVFWLTAALLIPTLFALSLVRPADELAQSAHAGGKAIDWNGVKTLYTDHRLLVFAACIVLFFLSSAAMLPIAATAVTKRHPELADVIIAVTILLPQAIVAGVSPWVGRSADRAGRRAMLLLGWSLLPLQGLLFGTNAFGPYTLLVAQALSGVSGAVFGVMMTLVASDLTRGTGQFNLTLGTLGVAIAIGASLSTSLAGTVASAFGDQAAYLGLALAGLCGLLLLSIGMPETRHIPVPALVPSA
jgi:MFS family permease